MNPEGSSHRKPSTLPPRNTSMGIPQRISRFFSCNVWNGYTKHLFLWLKIPLLSEKLVERHAGVSFHRLPFV